MILRGRGEDTGTAAKWRKPPRHVKVNAVEGGQGREKGRVIQLEWCVVTNVTIVGGSCEETVDGVDLNRDPLEKIASRETESYEIITANQA